MLTTLNILGMLADPAGKSASKMMEFCCHLCTTSEPHRYTIWSWSLLLLGLLAAWLLLRWRESRRWIMSHLIPGAFLVFSLGTVLYIIGFNGEGTAHNPLALLLRSMMASVEMFVSKSELIEVEPEVKGNPYYMMAFSIVHFLATCISAAFVLHILGVRTKSYLRMWGCLPSDWPRRGDLDLYVFFDLSPESIALAKSIHAEAREPHQIVFVRTPMEESHHERFSFGHLLSLANSQSGVAEDIINMDALLTYSRTRVSMYDQEASVDAWAKETGLTALHHFISKRARDKYFFALSPNEENNINTAIALRKLFPQEGRGGQENQDKDGGESACQHKAEVYCRAKQSSVTEFLSNERIKIVDSASLSIEEMRSNVLYQPVRYMKPDVSLGIATKPFKAMMIGFGDTGREAFKFLYEYSAMVCAPEVRMPFECYIIDPKGEALSKELLSACPGLAKDLACIHFLNGRTEDFISEVEVLIRELDYIVVCTNSGTENLSLGMRLLDLAYRHRDADRLLSVFMGLYEKAEYEKATDIARCYREEVTKGEQTQLFRFELVPFGKRETLFSYGNVVQEDIIKEAQAFHYKYEKTELSAFGAQPADSPEKEWEHRVNRCLANGLSGKAKLIQQETQDIANARHMLTKMMLMGIIHEVPATVIPLKEHDGKVKAEGVTAARTESNIFRLLHIAMVLKRVMLRIQEEVEKTKKGEQEGFCSFDIIQQVLSAEENRKYQALLQNIARCEHLRWVASNIMLGYTANADKEHNGKDYIRKTHACMVPCDELEKHQALRETIIYDYNTIWVGMQIETQRVASRTHGCSRLLLSPLYNLFRDPYK